MSRLSAAAVLFVAGLAVPVCAQRGGSSGGGGAHGGGGFSGHAAPAFHAGASFAAPRYGGYGGGASLGLRGSVGYGGRSGYHGGYGYRGSGYYRGPIWGGAWLGAGYPYGYGDVDASGYGDSADTMNPPGYDPNDGPAGPPPDYGAGAAGYGPGGSGGYAVGPAPGSAAPSAQGFRPTYRVGALPATVVPVPPPEDEDAITLVFKDGRPAEHIHNYAMTRDTLYVQDTHHREIPIAELDLQATKKANREAGVSFEVPQGPQ